MKGESALEQLVGAYLNQDVWDFYPDVMAGVDDFVSKEPGLAPAVLTEIDNLLAHEPTEAELDDLLRRLGAGFLPGDDGYRGWLVRIADRVRATTAG